MLAVTAADLNALLDSHAFTRQLGAVVTGIGDGECTLVVPWRQEHDRPGGILSGQIYMHAADVAFWLAIKTRLGLDDPSVTSSMSTAFLGAARQEPITCLARVRRLGGRLIYGEAECLAGARLVAHHTLTYARSPAGPGPDRDR